MQFAGRAAVKTAADVIGNGWSTASNRPDLDMPMREITAVRCAVPRRAYQALEQPINRRIAAR